MVESKSAMGIFSTSQTRTCNSLNLEDWLGLADLFAIAADDSEDLHGQVTVRVGVFSRLLQLLVEQPLVNLNPREASGLHCRFSLLAIQFSIRLRIETFKIRDLIPALSDPVRRMSVPALLALALSRNEG